MSALPYSDPARIPVIVGVGQVNDRPEDPMSGMDSVDLMEAALKVAESDAGGDWLSGLDSLAVVAQISFRHLGDVSKPLAERLGTDPDKAVQTPMPMGDSPIYLLNVAANDIRKGRISSAAIVGAEALRTAAGRAAQAAQNGADSGNATRDMSARSAPAYRARYGLVAPVDVYPLYENAGRAAYGQSLDEGQTESGEIWSRFSKVAADNPGAWLRKALTVEDIVTPSENNRLISFPYSKLMVANSSVNQGAGFIVTSLAEALKRGITEDRLIYVGHGAAAHEPDDFLSRDAYDHSASMAVSLLKTMELNGLTVDDLDLVELYSCFPCVPKMARRVIDWPVERPATVFGGLTFGGGPIGNYMSHAVVSMVEAMRHEGKNGLLFANGGFATHNHTLALSRTPLADNAPKDFDFQADAEAARGAIPPLAEAYTGPGEIETYTVLYDRKGEARFGVIVARSPGGERFLAKIPANDTEGLNWLTRADVQPVGTPGYASVADNGDTLWRRLHPS